MIEEEKVAYEGTPTVSNQENQSVLSYEDVEKDRSISYGRSPRIPHERPSPS